MGLFGINLPANPIGSAWDSLTKLATTGGDIATAISAICGAVIQVLKVITWCIIGVVVIMLIVYAIKSAISAYQTVRDIKSRVQEPVSPLPQMLGVAQAQPAMLAGGVSGLVKTTGAEIAVMEAPVEIAAMPVRTAVEAGTAIKGVELRQGGLEVAKAREIRLEQAEREQEPAKAPEPEPAPVIIVEKSEPEPVVLSRPGEFRTHPIADTLV